jgi:hypothetical protein
MRTRQVLGFAFVSVAFVFPSCGGGDESASQPGKGYTSDAGGAAGADASPDGPGGIGAFGGAEGGADVVPSIVCTPACEAPLECVNGLCLPHQAACSADGDCNYDTWCSAEGVCVPYAAPPDNKLSDPGCKLAIPAEMFVPQIKCEFMVAPPGDAYPDALEVRVTPMVVNFNQGQNGPTGSPSIIAPMGFTWGMLPAPNTCGYEDCNYRYGIIRVLKGTDCSLEANIGGDDIDPTPNGTREWARSSSPVAVADLDGDGVAEIIAYMVEEPEGQEVTVAWKRDAGTWKPLWPTGKATMPGGAVFDANVPVSGTAGANWAGPSVHDLDDDGIPEIIREGWVIDGKTGVVRASPPADYASYSVGLVSVLANLDADARIELTNGAHVWEFDGAMNQWVTEPWYEGAASPAGWVAVADFNAYDGTARAEIAVASNGKMTVFSADHSVFMGMDVAVPSGGGGPPTIADYDGDGLPEVGVAGADYYTVYDPDCQATPRPGGKCESRDRCDFDPNGNCPDLILWSRQSQDHSSRITGSSVFDFEADGKAEVVYADECFARVYSGSDGKVLFSQYRSSSTWLENPVVADVDGDFRSEMIVPSNGGASFTAAYCSGLLNADGVETHFAGLICKTGADCLSGACDQGLCRCTSSAQCCAAGVDAQCEEFGYKCAAPPSGAPGAGNTCRASYPHGLSGIRVYKDSHDRWVRSRTIWSQHAYAVTHIEESGVVPKTSQWKNNWTSPGLNNFRQNVPGEADGKSIGDLTSQVGKYFSCGAGGVHFKVPVCNRGTAPIGAGVAVTFYSGTDKLCEAVTTEPIQPGECVDAGCVWATPPGSAGAAVDVTVIPNEAGALEECEHTNNQGMVLDVYCQGVQ